MLEITKYKRNYTYKALKFNYRGRFLVYRYPYKYDSKEYIDKVIEFILHELENYHFELEHSVNIFYLEYDEDKGTFRFIDNKNFRINERKYLVTIFPDIHKCV